MQKRELIQEVNKRGFLLTEGALRTYIGAKYKLITLRQPKSGVANQYTNDHLEQICEIIAANRLGIPLSDIKDYLNSSNKLLFLTERIIANKKRVKKQLSYWNILMQITMGVESGQFQNINATDLYLRYFKESE